MPQFDVDAARKAGYSDDEILGHLKDSRNFDVDGALTSGYSKAEIFKHLSGTDYKAAAAPAPIVEPSLFGGFLSEVGRNAKRLGATILDTTGGQPVSTGMESTGHPVLDIAHGIMAGGVTGSPGITMASGPAAIVKASPAGQLVTSGGTLMKDVIKQFTDRPREPIKALTQALKPLATNTGFAKHAEAVLPDIKAAESALGKPIESVSDFESAVKLAKKNIWGQYQQIAGPQAARGVDASPVADAIMKSVPLKLKVQNPAAVEKITELADTYRRSFSLAELDDMLSTSNAELAGYYGKYPAAQRVTEAANPDIAQNVAEAKSLRNLIYEQLDSSGVARELKQRYGSLMNMEKEAQRRLNVAARQNPESLSEQMSRWEAAVRIGRAAVTFPARPLGALGDVAGAYAGRQMATALKEANSADALIANVFRNYTKSPTPFTFVPKPPIGAARQLPERAGAPYAMGEGGGFVPSETANQLQVTTGKPLTKAGYPQGISGQVSVKSGPAKGMTLSHIEPGITGVKNPVYVYTELGSGRQLRFTSPQK